MGTAPSVLRPQFRLRIAAGMQDCDGHNLLCGREYDLYWLHPQLWFNGGFEAGSYAHTIQDGGGTVAIAAGAARTGGNGLSVDASAVQAWQIQPAAAFQAAMSVIPGRRYCLSVWALNNAGNTVAELVAEFLDADGDVINAEETQAVTPSVAWTQHTLTTGAAPYGSVLIRPKLRHLSQACRGYFDDLQVYPVTDETHWITNTGMSAGAHTFAPLLAGDYAVLEFPHYTSAGSPFGQDDPVLRYDSGDAQYERKYRTPRRMIGLNFPHLPYDYGLYLLIWHRMTRARRFIYRDQFGAEHDVCWASEVEITQVYGTDLIDAQVELTEYL